MAVAWVGNNIVYQTGDALPTNVPAGTLAWDTLTEKVSKFNGTSWIPRYTRPSADYTILRDGNVTYCQDHNGDILSESSTTPETPIQYGLDNSLRASVEILKGSYNISAKLTISQAETYLKMSKGALITVPQGYTGAALELGPGSTTLARVEGGRFAEAGTPQKLWTGIYLHGTTGGINTCTFEEQYIRFANSAIKLHIDGLDGWINSCAFDKIFIDNSVNGVEFVDSGASQYGMNANGFNKITVQLTPDVSAYGFKDIQQKRNSFIHCDVWDPLTGMITSNILANAENTLIWGGTMTSKGFTDLSDHSIVYDEFTPLTIGRKINRSMLTLPSFGQWGIMQGNQSAGDGLLNALSLSGTVANQISYADGMWVRYTSAGASGDNAGVRYTAPYTYRGWNPTFKARFRINDTASTTRSFMGWYAGSGEFTGDDMLLNLHGIGVGHRTTDTNFQIFRNDGTGATVAASTTIAFDNLPHTFEIIALDYASTPRYDVYFDGVRRLQATSDIPAQQTAQYFQFGLEAAEAIAKTLDRFYIDARPGK